MYTGQQIITKLGIQDADPEVQNQTLQSIADTVANRILLAISDRLSEKDLVQVTDLLDKNQEEEAEKLLAEKISNFDEFKIKIEQETIDEIARNTSAVSDQIEAIKSEKIAP